MYCRKNVMKFFLLVWGSCIFLSSSLSFCEEQLLAPTEDVREEVTSLAGDVTTMDFDADFIEGKRRMPLGSLINRADVTSDLELVEIRENWLDKILESIQSLDRDSSQDD